MPHKAPSAILDLLVDPLSRCLTTESAKRVLDLRADARVQAMADRLADKCNEGTLTPDEQELYAAYVSFATFVGLLKSKARQMIANSGA
jgi:hypothetical protein